MLAISGSPEGLQKRRCYPKSADARRKLRRANPGFLCDIRAAFQAKRRRPSNKGYRPSAGHLGSQQNGQAWKGRFLSTAVLRGRLYFSESSYSAETRFGAKSFVFRKAPFCGRLLFEKSPSFVESFILRKVPFCGKRHFADKSVFV